MKIKYAQLRNPNFNQSLTKLLHAPMPLKNAKRLLDLVYKIRDEQIKADELAGVLKTKVNTEKPEDEHRDIADYLATEVEFEFEPLSIEKLSALEISAAELLLLDGIVK